MTSPAPTCLLQAGEVLDIQVSGQQDMEHGLLQDRERSAPGGDARCGHGAARPAPTGEHGLSHSPRVDTTPPSGKRSTDQAPGDGDGDGVQRDF